MSWAVPERAVQRDLNARHSVLFAVCAMTGVSTLDLVDGSLGIVFDIGFVLTVFMIALWTEQSSLLVPAILPPFLLVAAIVIIAVITPSAIDTSTSGSDPVVLQRVLVAILNHATALVIGHSGALIIIAGRRLGNLSSG